MRVVGDGLQSGSKPVGKGSIPLRPATKFGDVVFNGSTLGLHPGSAGSNPVVSTILSTSSTSRTSKTWFAGVWMDNWSC